MTEQLKGSGRKRLVKFWLFFVSFKSEGFLHVAFDLIENIALYFWPVFFLAAKLLKRKKRLV